jgi:hypothetical protein
MAVAAWLVFWGLFVPLGFLLRLAGIDPLQRRFDPASPSYWRSAPPDSGAAMTQQT